MFVSYTTLSCTQDLSCLVSWLPSWLILRPLDLDQFSLWSLYWPKQLLLLLVHLFWEKESLSRRSFFPLNNKGVTCNPFLGNFILPITFIVIDVTIRKTIQETVKSLKETTKVKTTTLIKEKEGIATDLSGKNFFSLILRHVLLLFLAFLSPSLSSQSSLELDSERDDDNNS